MAYQPELPPGQAVMASSAPVVIASDQSAIPISGTVTIDTSLLATSAKQDTGNSSLSTIAGKDFATQTTLAALNAKVTAVNTGAVVISSGTVTTVSTVTNLSQMSGAAISMGTGTRDAGTQRVTIATNDTVPVTFTGSTDVATQTTLALIKAKTDNIPALGQALAAASTPVVLTAAQITTLTPPAAITGFATVAAQTDKSQFTKITDGTDTALVTAAGEQNVLESNSAAIKTSVELIDNAISGAGFNITQQGGVAVSLNTGVRDTGTQRVTIATNDVVPITDNSGSLTVDQPTGTNLHVVLDTTSTTAVTQATGTNLHTVVDSGVITTVSTVTNLSQLGGAAVPIGAGTEAAAIRVTLPTNGTGIVGLAAGTQAIGKLAANSGVDIGDVDVTSSVAGTLYQGQNADIDATAEQVTTVSNTLKFGMTIRAEPSNSGIVYIGASTVTADSADTTDGFPLYAGESFTYPVSNTNLVYAIASVANQAVRWTAI